MLGAAGGRSEWASSIDWTEIDPTETLSRSRPLLRKRARLRNVRRLQRTRGFPSWPTANLRPCSHRHSGRRKNDSLVSRLDRAGFGSWLFIMLCIAVVYCRVISGQSPAPSGVRVNTVAARPADASSTGDAPKATGQDIALSRLQSLG